MNNKKLKANIILCVVFYTICCGLQIIRKTFRIAQESGMNETISNTYEAIIITLGVIIIILSLFVLLCLWYCYDYGRKANMKWVKILFGILFFIMIFGVILNAVYVITS